MWDSDAQKQNNQPTMANAWVLPPGKRKNARAASTKKLSSDG